MNKDKVLNVIEQFEIYLPTKQDKALYKRKCAEYATEITKIFEEEATVNGQGTGTDDTNGNAGSRTAKSGSRTAKPTV